MKDPLSLAMGILSPRDLVKQGAKLDRAMARQVSAFMRAHGTTRRGALLGMRASPGRIASEVGASEAFVQAWIEGELRRA